jgi:predicted regulator of Ras-like GTPase activity (Roadblock/LC7/MglB family)
MPDLNLITSLPEVQSGVLGDVDGNLLQAVDEADGETVAAVMGFVAASMLGAGETLGLGRLHRVSIGGPTKASVLVVEGAAVISASVAPPSALAAVEKFLDSTK